MLLALAFGLFQIADVHRSQSIRGQLLQPLQENQNRLFAVNKAAESYRESHLKDAASPAVLQQQFLLTADANNLIAKQERPFVNLMAFDRSARFRSTLYSRLSSAAMIPFLAFILWRAWAGQRNAQRLQGLAAESP